VNSIPQQKTKPPKDHLYGVLEGIFLYFVANFADTFFLILLQIKLFQDLSFDVLIKYIHQNIQ